jgi:hypothetical protein
MESETNGAMSNLSLRRALSIMLCGFAAALMTLTCGPAGAAVTEVPWDAARSLHGKDPDARLEATVSASASFIGLGDLISDMARQTGCQLACEPDLAERRLAVRLANVRLKDAMSELADFLMCEWWVTGDGADRSYTLKRTSALVEAERSAAERAEQLLTAVVFPSPPSPDDPVPIPADRLTRLQEHFAALALPGDALVKQSEASDPWLCADVLTPAARPFLEFLAGLPSARLTAVASDPKSIFRLQDLPRSLQDHMWACVTGHYRRDFGVLGQLENPEERDRVNRFPTYADRWAHATMQFRWVYGGLECSIVIPDLAGVGCQIIGYRDANPCQALWKLAYLGYHRLSAEFGRTTVHAAYEAWDVREKARVAAQRQAQAAELASGADRSDTEVLSRRVMAWEDKTKAASPIAVLFKVSEAAGVPLLADGYLGETPPHIPPEVLCSEQTLQQALEAWTDWGRGWATWSKPIGRFLQIRGRERLDDWLGRIPASVLAGWDKAMAGKKSVDLQTVADMGAALTPFQSLRWRSFGKGPTVFSAASSNLGTRFLVVIGENRGWARLAGGQEIPYAEMTPHQRELVFSKASESRPWLRPQDLSNATITLVPRPGSTTGRPIVEFRYHLADAPTDLDVLGDCNPSVPVPQSSQSRP